MKRIILLLSLTLGTATNAAVHSPGNGFGEVLFVPYYTTNAGWSSLLSIVNSTNEAKAIRVNIREARIGQVVSSINLYLGPYDVWTASLYDPDGGDSGIAGLNSEDGSCTLPDLQNDNTLPTGSLGRRYIPMSIENLDDYRDLADDFQGFEQDTRSGFIEIVEMATVVGDHAEHIAAMTTSCAELANSWQTGAWSTDPLIDTDAPQGGLTAQVTLLHATNATAMTANATAIDGLLSIAAHTPPGDPIPSASTGDIPGANATSLVIYDNEPILTHWETPLDAIQAVLMRRSITNEFFTTGGIESEWVVTFPTKASIIGDVPARAPFTEWYNETKFGAACEVVICPKRDYVFAGWLFDQTGQPLQDGDCASIGVPPGGIRFDIEALCYAVTNMEFNESSIFDSSLAEKTIIQGFETGGVDGLGSLWLTQQGQLTNRVENPNAENHTHYGLPVIGFLATRMAADEITAGVLRNFGMLAPHWGPVSVCLDCE